MLEGTPQLLISSLEYSPYVGRIAVGRMRRGVLRPACRYHFVKETVTFEKSRVKELLVFIGLAKVKTEEVRSGDICAVVGIDGFEIGDPIADIENPDHCLQSLLMSLLWVCFLQLTIPPFSAERGNLLLLAI